jgi:hypothetical protein
MGDPEFASIDPAIREMDRVQLEMIVTGSPAGVSLDQVKRISHARAELIRRDREHAEQQERSRRDFESALADKQLSAATDVAKATRSAMWAAAAAALGAIVQAVMAVASYICPR